MQINGGVRFCEQGMKASIRAMHVQSELIGMINENVAGFDKVGYQRKEPIVSSFTEYQVLLMIKSAELWFLKIHWIFLWQTRAIFRFKLRKVLN